MATKGKRKAPKLSEPQMALLRRVSPPKTEPQDDPSNYLWEGKSGAWYLTWWRRDPRASDTDKVNTATAKALVRLGYLEASGGTEDLPPCYFLSAKGAALIEAEKRAALLAATKGERERAKELADALLVANQLDGRAELNGVYPANGVAGLYEVDYYDTLSAGRFVVVVDTIAGTTDLQRQ